MKPGKITLLLLILSLVFTSTYSQVNQFSLSDFKLPDLERKTLETFLDLVGNNYSHKAPGSFYYHSPEEKTNSYSGIARVNYAYFLNDVKYQKETLLNLSMSAYFTNYKYLRNMFYFPEEFTGKSKLLSPTINYQRNSRWYYNSENFIETNLQAGYSLQGVWEDRTYIDEFKTNTHSLSFTLPLKVGQGRIEQVQDARHAIYLYDELAKIERIKTDQAKEEIIEFANLIAKLKNKRFFDSRIKRIKELETIDSFLLASGHLLESDARYFTTLADYWDFGGRPVRNSGYRFSLGLYPGYYYSHYNTTEQKWGFDPSKIALSAFQFNGGVEFIYEEPLALSLQNTLELHIYGGILEVKITEEIITDYDDFKTQNTLRIPNIQFGLYHSLGFYPNTRTELTLRSSLQYIQLMDETNIADKIYGVDAKGFKPAVDFLLNYYISPQFRLNILASIFYIWQDSQDEVIINFDPLPGSNPLNSILPTYPQNYYDFFKEKEFRNSFRISFVYSFL